MNEFHVGDRVICCVEEAAKYDYEREEHIIVPGTVAVIHRDGRVGVHHDVYIGGHSCSGAVPCGYGWWYWEISLVLYVEECLPKVEDLI